MERQYSNPYSSCQDDYSKPRNLQINIGANWQAQVPITHSMMRHPSNSSADSGYQSGSSHDIYSPQYSPMDKPYGDVPPTVYEGETYTAQQYSQPSYLPPSQPLHPSYLPSSQPLQSSYLPSSQPLQPSNSNPSSSSRATISSMGLKDDSLLKRGYKFVVQKGQEPYFERKSWDITADVPVRIYLDSPRSPQKNVFPCQYPACHEKSQEKIFKRPADLERHYRNVHADSDQKDQLPCDYDRCQRSKDKQPFTRKDHFRDHLRDYHKEDLGCAKGEKIYEKKKWIKLQEAWIAERKIQPKWWRCPKCLIRVDIGRSGWECPDCKHPCDPERAGRIEAVRAKTISGPANTSAASETEFEHTQIRYPCALCDSTAWVWEPYKATYEPCPTCQPEQYCKEEEDWTIGSGS